eukprot:COSAG04_NODE_29683_length_267_cov_0.910714_1_plen_42_part_01
MCLGPAPTNRQRAQDAVAYGPANHHHYYPSLYLGESYVGVGG